MLNPRFRNVIAVFASALIASVFAPAATAGGLSVELTPVLDKAVLGVEDGAPMRFVVTNETSFDIAILEWQTPINGLTSDLFVVERDGVRVDYIGLMVSRMAPGPEDWLRIESGESVSVVVDLAKSYDMSEPGTYTVRFDFPLQVRDLMRVDMAAAHRDQQATSFSRVESNELYVTTEGSPTPMVRKRQNGRPDSTEGCTDTQMSVILSAQARGRGYADNADSYLTSLPVSARPSDTFYRTWFGEYDAGRYSTVNGTYGTTYTAMGKTYQYTCVDCRRGYIAYVYKTIPYEIWICPDFFSVNTTFQGGAILHETVHWNVVASADDYAYGESACMALADSDPDKAIDNADNLRLFAEKAP